MLWHLKFTRIHIHILHKRVTVLINYVISEARLLLKNWLGRLLLELIVVVGVI